MNSVIGGSTSTGGVGDAIQRTEIFTDQILGRQSVKIGLNAGLTNQGLNAIAVGQDSGRMNSGNSSVSLGPAAGYSNAGYVSVAVGSWAGNTSSGDASIAICEFAGFSNSGVNSIAIGRFSGRNNQAANSIILNASGVLLDNDATNDTSSCFIKPIKNKVATGKEVLMYDPLTYEVTRTAITNVAPVTTADLALKADLALLQSDSVKIGQYTNAGLYGVAIGFRSGEVSQQTSAVAIGDQAGRTSQGVNSIAIGNRAGQTSQAQNSIIINASGATLNNDATNDTNSCFIKPIKNKVATDKEVLMYNTLTNEVTSTTLTNISAQADQTQIKLGLGAGATSQGTLSVAVGANAGLTSQGYNSVAVGGSAGKNTQGTNAVAIGYSAGYGNVSSQGNNSIAIGAFTGFNTQAAQSIIINATGGGVDNAVANSCVIKPIRQGVDIGNLMLNYNTATGEVLAVPLETIVVSPTNFRLFHYDPTINSVFLVGVPDLVMVYAKMTVAMDNANAGYANIHCNRRTPNNTGGYLMSFTHINTVTGVSNYTGSISTTSSGVAFNTSSDYRLKNIVGTITNASTRVLALKPIRFSWKSTGQEVDGFLAHEAQEVVPEAVQGTKDEVNEDGTPKYQGIDQSKLVPLLTAALQDALKRIEVLEALVLV